MPNALIRAAVLRIAREMSRADAAEELLSAELERTDRLRAALRDADEMLARAQAMLARMSVA